MTSEPRSYTRICKYCYTEIEISNHTGKWTPYSLNTGKVHDCPKNPRNTGIIQTSYHRGGF